MSRFDIDTRLRQGGFTLELAMSTDARAVVLFGPSGSGKTTALEMMAGLRTAEEGRVAINGRVLFDRATGVNVPPRLRRIGYVPQDVLLFPHLGVRGNVQYGRREGVRIDERALLDLLELHPLLDRTVDEADARDHHHKLIKLCDRLAEVIEQGGSQLRDLARAFDSPGACADAVAAALIMDADTRQELLEARCPLQRLQRTLGHVSHLLCELAPCAETVN